MDVSVLGSVESANEIHADETINHTMMIWRLCLWLIPFPFVSSGGPPLLNHYPHTKRRIDVVWRNKKYSCFWYSVEQRSYFVSACPARE
jgi:hypothetical protein